MLIRNKNLSVIPVTTHIDIKQISRKISLTKIINKVKTADSWFKYHFNKKPKLEYWVLIHITLNSEQDQKKIKSLFLP